MFASVTLLFLSVFLLLYLLQNRRPKNFPPGPRSIPIFGNLLQVDLKNPLADLERLSRQYGKVYSLVFGSHPEVIVNGLEAIKEAFLDKAADFSGRPPDHLALHALQLKARAPGVVLADYGPIWKEQRRFSLMTLRNFGLGKQSMEQRILAEIPHVTKALEQRIGQTIDLHHLFNKASCNIICQVLFAKHFEYDDDFLKFSVDFFHEISKLISGFWGVIYDSLPMVRSLPLPFQKGFQLFQVSKEKHLQIIAEEKKTRVPGKPRHFIDCFLDEMERRGDDGSSFSEEQLCVLLLDLQFAGTDTVANTLLSGFLYLSYYSHIQERCQQEIDSVLGRRDHVSFDDRLQMPYVQAVIHEIQRKANVAPLGVFHCTTKDTELMGYSIPRGTVINGNLSSVLSEEGRWKFPHEFNPENFLNDHGEFFKPEAFIPFSAGPRVCLGEALARMELFLMVVTLLRKFTFSWPEGAGEPDFIPVFGLTQTPKLYRIKVQLRGGNMTSSTQM